MKVKHLVFLSPIILSGCASKGDFDSAAFVRNPVVMVIIAVITLYFVFKSQKK